MRRSVDRVFADSRDSDLADSLRANVSRFAAYKADYVKTTIENILNDASIPAKDKQAYIDANMNAFSAYQATEETTATSRSRTAKQWKEFNDPQRLRLFPNLRWLPSRSIEKRQSHIQFYDHVWSKGDDFWNHNTPGTEWNCKCDVEETDDPVTDKSEIEEYIKKIKVPPALEGNPAETGKVFTDDASYISKARQGAESDCRRLNRNLMTKQAREINRNRHVTYVIDDTEYEFDFKKFRHKNNKVDICYHFAGSMFGNDDFWLKNEILINPQPYLDNGITVGYAGIDYHNSGIATQELKYATDEFFYVKTKLANSNDIILHVGRYKSSRKLYLYYATKELPVYAKTFP